MKIILKAHLIKPRSLFLLLNYGELWCKELKKSYGDIEVAQNPLYCSLPSTSPECFIDQNIFFVHESWQQCGKKSMNPALYSLLWSLGHQYIVGSLS